ARSDSMASPRLRRRNSPHMPPTRNTDLAKMNLLVLARIAFYGHPLPGARRAWSRAARPRFLWREVYRPGADCALRDYVHASAERAPPEGMSAGAARAA